MPQAPAQNQNFIEQSNFSGGTNDSDSIYHVPPDCSTKITNMLVDGSELKPVWGVRSVGTGTFDAVYDWTAQVFGQTTKMRLAIKNQVILIEEQSAGVGTGVYRPMYNAASDPETGSSNVPWAGDFAESLGYLYITGLGRKVWQNIGNTPSSSYGSAPLVFDGYAAQLAATVSSGSLTTVTFTGTLPYGITNLAGYRVTLVDVSGLTETRTIVSGSGPYTVDTAFSNACTNGKCVVAGINYMGIEAPGLDYVAIQWFQVGQGVRVGGLFQMTVSAPGGTDGPPSPQYAFGIAADVVATGTGFGQGGVEAGGNTTYPKATRLSIAAAITDALAKISLLPQFLGMYSGVTIISSGGYGTTPWPLYDSGSVSDTSNTLVPVVIQFVGLNGLPAPIVTINNLPSIFPYLTSPNTNAGGLTLASVSTMWGNVTTYDVGGNTTLPTGNAWLTANLAPVAGTTKGSQVYTYRIVYSNLERGVSSNPVEFSVLPLQAQTSGGVALTDQQVTLKNLPGPMVGSYLSDSYGQTWGHFQVDQIQIWRTLIGSGTFYLVDTLVKDSSGAFPTSYIDTKSDNVISSPAAVIWSDAINANHDLPPALDMLMAFDASLRGRNSFIEKDLRKSNTLGPEYWPLISPEGVTGTSDLVTHGTYIEIGTFSDPIMGMLPDIGSFYTSGIQGSCIIVFTKTKAKRVYGETLDTLQVVETGLPGLVATKGAQNCEGILMWPSAEGIVSCPEGGMTATVVSRGIRNDLSVNADDWANAASAYWKSYYIATMPDSAGTMRGWCCYLGADHIGGNRLAWTVNAGIVSSWYFTDSLDLIFTGTSKVFQVDPTLFTVDGAAIPIAFRKEFPALAGKDNLVDKWMTGYVHFVLETDATANIDLTLKVWNFGQIGTDLPTGDPMRTYAKTLVCDGAQFNKARRMISFQLSGCLCRWPMIELSTSVVSDFRILQCVVESASEGDARSLGE